jgi:hypothetical protein
VPRSETVHIVAAIVFGGLAVFWGAVASKPMVLLAGMPFVFAGVLLFRIVRLERLVDELRAQRAEAR